MLQKVDRDRLDKVLAVVKESGIRFPVAEITRKLSRDKGMVSAYLSGKKPISDNFYSSFMQHFAPEKKANIVIKEADVGKEVSRLIEITINQQAAINVLMKAFENLSEQAVKKEADRLFDEYAKKQ